MPVGRIWFDSEHRMMCAELYGLVTLGDAKTTVTGICGHPEFSPQLPCLTLFRNSSTSEATLAVLKDYADFCKIHDRREGPIAYVADSPESETALKLHTEVRKHEGLRVPKLFLNKEEAIAWLKKPQPANS